MYFPKNHPGSQVICVLFWGSNPDTGAWKTELNINRFWTFMILRVCLFYQKWKQCLQWLASHCSPSIPSQSDSSGDTPQFLTLLNTTLYSSAGSMLAINTQCAKSVMSYVVMSRNHRANCHPFSSKFSLRFADEINFVPYVNISDMIRMRGCISTHAAAIKLCTGWFSLARSTVITSCAYFLPNLRSGTPDLSLWVFLTLGKTPACCKSSSLKRPDILCPANNSCHPNCWMMALLRPYWGVMMANNPFIMTLFLRGEWHWTVFRHRFPLRRCIFSMICLGKKEKTDTLKLMMIL